jgi:hypothetical protein
MQKKCDKFLYVSTKKNDASVIGYINKDYLLLITSGGYYEKYQKYKQKYLSLKHI